MLSEIAAVAEIIASVGVVLSLLFVGFQLRDSNRQAQVTAIQNATAQEIETTAVFADHYETWDKLVNGEAIEGRELRKAILLYNILMSETENRYHQYKLGYLHNQSWEGRLASLRKAVTAPVFPLWRQANSGINHSRDFLVLVDDLRAASEQGRS